MTERAAIEVTGLVQGVGFRPFVYSLARSLDLRGFVQNCGSHVFVDVEGDAASLSRFIERLTSAPPVRAAIDGVRHQPLPPARHRTFEIATSAAACDAVVSVPPDLATCRACLAELFDPANRRYRHAFIACTSCGPRYSMIARLPFDRAGTAMGAFPMCAACAREYGDPADRRFHAEAICCPDCGPRLAATAGAGVLATDDAALALAATRLEDGAIVAVKGIGGFHLACDATSDAAVATLRRRKHRESKPLAVMLPPSSVTAMRSALGASTMAMLESPERPILLVDRRSLTVLDRWGCSQHVARDCPDIGVFLPYSPVHHLLLAGVDRPLVMTSGNRSDEPMACDDRQALAALGGIADLFLTHDRSILHRCDDSVGRVAGGAYSPIRRGRGAAPLPIALAEHSPQPVLGVGGDLKNSVCLMNGSHAYVSSHVGSIETLEGIGALEEAASRLTGLLALEPVIVAHDLHPDFLSTRLAGRYPEAVRLAVQHHHAHVLACSAEHRVTGPVIGVAFDGAGLGTDGAVWGGEFLVVEGLRSQRAAHLACVPLPGGDRAAREPWRMAVAHLASAGMADEGRCAEDLANRIDREQFRVIRQMVAGAACAPPTSSMGRLFDAVASLLGIRDHADFEGQAAMALEARAASEGTRRYAFALDRTREPWRIDAAPVIRGVASDVAAGVPAGDVAASFHRTVADLIAGVAAGLSRDTGIRQVALTGGVFQNARLLEDAGRALTAAGLTVLIHRQVPCNDGGLSLGQALYAARWLREQA